MHDCENTPCCRRLGNVMHAALDPPPNTSLIVQLKNTSRKAKRYKLCYWIRNKKNFFPVCKITSINWYKHEHKYEESKNRFKHENTITTKIQFHLHTYRKSINYCKTKCIKKIKLREKKLEMGMQLSSSQSSNSIFRITTLLNCTDCASGLLITIST